jgi:hypothetical protein
MMTHDVSLESPKPKTLARQVIELKNSNSQGHLDPLMVFKPVLSQANKAIYLTIIQEYHLPLSS